MKYCAVILVRGGSKSIPRKNLLEWKGTPLMVYPIRAAKECEAVDTSDIWVSTDDDEMAELALAQGVNVIRRPPELADDLSTDLEAMQHFLSQGPQTAKYDAIIHLRATYPTISPEIIDRAVNLFTANRDGYDSLRSVVRAEQSPYKMWRLQGCDALELAPLLPNHDKHSSPRQVIPPVYWQNAAIDIVKTWTVIHASSMTGDRVLPYIMQPGDGVDIDTFKDLEKLGELK